MNNKTVKENTFDAAPGGMSGALNYQSPIGTHSSPDVSQDPNHFDSSDYNKFYNVNSTGQPDTSIVDTSGSFDKDVNALFKKQEKPTPDEIITGINYELLRMIKKDKGVAKQIVIQNLKKDPHYYSKLNMLNITDKDMDMDTTPFMQERINILNRMIKEKNLRKPEPNQEILNILKEKQERNSKKINDLMQRSINS